MNDGLRLNQFHFDAATTQVSRVCSKKAGKHQTLRTTAGEISKLKSNQSHPVYRHTHTHTVHEHSELLYHVSP